MRPSKHEWAMQMAQIVATRSTCLRRQVGCVLVNERHHILATGYNGVAAGLPHCNEIPMGYTTHLNACPGAQSLSGQNLDGCEAIHAEQNALLQCPNVHEIMVAYVTVSPCMTCTKLLLNTSCKSIMFLEDCAHNKARILWERSGRYWSKLIPGMPVMKI